MLFLHSLCQHIHGCGEVDDVLTVVVDGRLAIELEREEQEDSTAGVYILLVCASVGCVCVFVCVFVCVCMRVSLCVCVRVYPLGPIYIVSVQEAY